MNMTSMSVNVSAASVVGVLYLSNAVCSRSLSEAFYTRIPDFTHIFSRKKRIFICVLTLFHIRMSCKVWYKIRF